MVKIRLKRLGRKKRPFYRIVVMDIRERRQGAPLAELGYFNPLSRELKLDKTAAQSWISKGAIPSETVGKLIEKAPESGELIVLERAQKERLSKKAQARLNKEAEAKAAAAEQAQVSAAQAELEASQQAQVSAAQAEPEASQPAEEATAPDESEAVAEA